MLVNVVPLMADPNLNSAPQTFAHYRQVRVFFNYFYCIIHFNNDKKAALLPLNLSAIEFVSKRKNSSSQQKGLFTIYVYTFLQVFDHLPTPGLQSFTFH